MNRIGDPRYEQPALKSPADMTDDELNAAVSREVMRWILVDRNWVDAAGREQRPGPGVIWSRRQGRRVHIPSWSPATDIAAAMGDVVPQIQRDGVVTISVGTVHVYETTCTILTDPAAPGGAAVRARVTASTPARAICEAALAAVRG